MDIKKLKGKKVTVMGIGLHGGAVEVIKWFLNKGTLVTATDLNSKENLAVSLEKLKNLKNLKIITGQHRPEDFTLADMVIINPAVKWDNKYVQLAIKNKVPVEMDSSLFFQLIPFKNKVIGITGTKGKTTTSLLIYQILKQAGFDVIKVGIGQEPVLNKLDLITKDTIIIFELSSWRLSALGRIKMSPSISVMTNIYPDHLNYYSSMEAYKKDKKYVFNFQQPKDKLILNGDNEELKELVADVKGEKIYFSTQISEFNQSAVFIKKGKIFFKTEIGEREICELNEIKLKGGHNISNVLAALAVCLSFSDKIKNETIKLVLKDFKNIPHRIEFVREVDGVKYYNDTTATIPQATIAAINSFSKPMNLICGGSSKKVDLTGLGKKISRDENIKKVYLLQGEATEFLKKEIIAQGGKNKIVGIFENLESSLTKIKAESQTGEIVLFSPGCASFGMFKNEFDRGEKFIKIVNQL